MVRTPKPRPLTLNPLNPMSSGLRVMAPKLLHRNGIVRKHRRDVVQADLGLGFRGLGFKV